jgi:glycosyltransferase involved in cell wall biosynthesis
VALGADAARITVVPYGVDTERFKPGEAARAAVRGRLHVPEEAPLIVAVGRLVRKKGFEYLIEAAAQLKDEHPTLRLVVAGDGDLGAALRAQAARAGIADRVHFLGNVPHQDVPALLAAADVAVAPSIHDEAGNVDGLPNTVLEILASGTALVTTPVGGIGAVAVDRETARIVRERDAAALAAAIGGLLREPVARATLGRRAREMVRRDHAWTRTTDAYEAIYNRVAP